MDLTFFYLHVTISSLKHDLPWNHSKLMPKIYHVQQVYNDFVNYSLQEAIYLLIRFSKGRYFLKNTKNADTNGVNK